MDVFTMYKLFLLGNHDGKFKSLYGTNILIDVFIYKICYHKFSF